MPQRVLEVYRELAGDRYRVEQVYGLDDFVSPLFEPDWRIHVRELFPCLEAE